MNLFYHKNYSNIANTPDRLNKAENFLDNMDSYKVSHYCKDSTRMEHQSIFILNKALKGRK